MDYQAAQTVATGMTVGQLVAVLLLGMGVAVGGVGLVLFLVKLIVRPLEKLPDKIDTLTTALTAIEKSLWSKEDIDNSIAIKINEHDKDKTAHSVQKVGTMKTIVMIVATFAIAIFFTGCQAANSLAKGISEKSISGSGTVSIQEAGLDTTTQIPRMKSTVVTGDYASAKDGQTALQYRWKKAGSFWNSDAITEEIVYNGLFDTKEEAEAAAKVIADDMAKRHTEGSK